MRTNVKIIIIPILIFLISTIFVIIPDNLKTPKDFIEQLGYFSYLVKVILVICIIFIFIIYHIASISGVLKKFNQFDKVRLSIIDKNVENSMSEYKKLNIDFRLNVMIAKRKLIVWNRLLKFQTPFLYQKVFQTVYNYNMDRDKDKNLGLITNQGVAGFAYEDNEGKSYIVDLVNTNEKFNLTDEQLKRTAGIKFIISTPILKWDAESGKLTDKTIGVVNLDSKKNKFDAIQKKIASDDLIKNSFNIADLISMLY